MTTDRGLAARSELDHLAGTPVPSVQFSPFGVDQAPVHRGR